MCAEEKQEKSKGTKTSKTSKGTETFDTGLGKKQGEKVDLHLHLDGSLPPETAARFLEEEGIFCSPSERKRMLTVQENCRSLEEYLRCFELPLKILNTERHLEAAAEDLTIRLGGQGLTYAEIRFAPQLHKGPGMTQQKAAEAVLAGIKKGLAGLPGLKIGVLFCMMVTGEDRENEETVELAEACLGKGAAGLDLAGAEGAVPMEHFRRFFVKAAGKGVPYTIHAGECGDVENIRKAVSFGARRIGHGCAAIRDRECMELLRREGIVLEMCPTSNIQTKAVSGIQEHPIRRFLDYGIRVTVNTDNMTVSDTTLEKEYRLLRKNLGFTEEEIRMMNLDARKAGFLPDIPR